MTEVWDTVVVGSGPAGLTAAIYAARGGASSLVLAGEKWGGQLMLTTLVENFPGFPGGIQGPDLMLAMRRQAEDLGAKILEIDVASVDVSGRPFEIVTADSQRFTAKTIIIATGALTKWLGVPGEAKLIGRGVSSCAPCDAAFFKEKRVIVVGGGDTAMEESLFLAKFASSVTILHRRDKFRASKIMQDKVLKNPKIKVLWNTEVTEIMGNQKVEGVRIKNNKSGETLELFIDGVFVAIGHRPASDLFKGKIDMDKRGYVVNKGGQNHSATNIPGIFVAGDLMDAYYKQAITAAGTGCAAAMDMLKYLEESGN